MAISGKGVNGIGSFGVFREQINNADEELQDAGNYTECPTDETLKKAASDYRKKMYLDEDIFKECRILKHAYCKEDVSSNDVFR